MTTEWHRFNLSLLDEQTLHILAASGWFPGRVRDPTAFYEFLAGYECVAFPEVMAIVGELGGLVVATWKVGDAMTEPEGSLGSLSVELGADHPIETMPVAEIDMSGLHVERDGSIWVFDGIAGAMSFMGSREAGLVRTFRGLGALRTLPADKFKRRRGC